MQLVRRNEDHELRDSSQLRPRDLRNRRIWFPVSSLTLHVWCCRLKGDASHSLKAQNKGITCKREDLNPYQPLPPSNARPKNPLTPL